MPKSQKEVTLVGAHGVKLPLTTGTLVSESGDSLVFHTTETVGRGRGTKTVKRQYVIPRCSLAYYYSDEEVEGEEAVAAAPKESKVPKAAKEPKVAKEPKRKGKAEESDNSDVKDAIMTALQEAGEPVGMGTIKGSTGLDPAVLRPLLKELEEAGTVVRDGEKRGTVYSMANGVKSAKKAATAQKKRVSKSDDAKDPPFKGASLFDDSI